MNIARVALIFIGGAITASCSEKTAPTNSLQSQPEEARTRREIAAASEARRNKPNRDRSAELLERKEESELQPREEEIAEDCVAFLRSTKTVPANNANADCLQCDATTEAKEVLKFGGIQVDRMERSESTCEVNVTIRARFNPSGRGSIAGGLTAWISPGQKAQYLQGETPSDEQIYKVRVIYRRDRKGWRPVEFDRS